MMFFCQPSRLHELLVGGLEHVGAKPHVRPHPKNTLKQYRIRVIGGGMKTLAVRRDFDCCFVGFRVLI